MKRIAAILLIIAALITGAAEEFMPKTLFFLMCSIRLRS